MSRGCLSCPKRSPGVYYKGMVDSGMIPAQNEVMRNHVKTGRSGFTLVEVLVAMTLLGIGLAGAYYAISAAMQMRKFSHDQYIGTLIANNRIEFAKNQPFTQLVNLGETGKRVNEYGVDDDDGRFMRSTAISNFWAGSSNLASITVNVVIPHPLLAGGIGGTATVASVLRR